MKCKLKCRFPLLLVLFITACMMFAGCEPAITPEDPDTSSLDEQVLEPVHDLVISYLRD